MSTSTSVIRTYLTIAGLYTLSTSLIWGVNTLFLLNAGLDIMGVFVANAVFTGSMALFELPTGVFADTRGRRASFLLSVVTLCIGTLGYVGAGAAGVQTIAAVGVGLADSFWLAVTLYLIVMGAMGVWGPVRQAYIHQSIPSEQRASVISFDSLLSSGGSLVGQLGLGRIAQTQSIAAGYIWGGLTTVLVLPVIVLLRRLDEPADVIVGTAGKRGLCAAQGIPSVSAVDANTHVVTIADV